MDFKEKLKARAEKEGISLTPKQLGQFELFYKMLIETNKSMNLTAITDEDEVIEKHFIDSLSCRRVVDMSQIRTGIDVGTGAGFPGIPLKIVYPEIDFVLVDSLNKRVKFLKDVKEVEDQNIRINAYIPEWIDKEINGINYRLNTTYKIKEDIRQWNKVNVKYVEKYTNESIEEILQDEDGDNIYFYSERIPNGL